MKKLATILDTVLNKEYDLYEINAKVLEGLLKKTNKMSRVKLQTFNWNTKLPENLTELMQIIDYKKENYSGDKDFRLKLEIVKEIQEIKNNTYINDKVKTVSELGYELMPIVVEAKNKDITNPDCEVKLLDGFRRMFYVDEVPDKNILVKVYDELDDTAWVNAMIVFNSWKFVAKKSFWRESTDISKSIIDRGFSLGLYLRYGIDFIKLTSYTYNDIWRLLNTYFNDVNAYETLWNNSQFHNDILILNQIENYKPVFSFKSGKKKIKETIFDCMQIKCGQPTFIEALAIQYITFLGLIRRKEYEIEKQENKIINRKEFTLDAYKIFLAQEDLQEHFIKLSEMRIPGYIDNYIKKYLKDEMKKYLFKKYLDIDLEPQKVKVEHINVDINEIEF